MNVCPCDVCNAPTALGGPEPVRSEEERLGRLAGRLRQDVLERLLHHARDGKAGWDVIGFRVLINRLREETNELEAAFVSFVGDDLGSAVTADLREEVVREAADVAAFAAFIAHRARKLAP